jgi:hypothetical protein
MDGQYSYLHQMVERSTTALLGRDGKPSDGLVFLGNPQLVFPRLLFEDPVLEPVDRNVWAAIKLAAADGDSITAFPSYEELMRRCNVGSKATISRSLSILRSTRWLTVCKASQRDSHGRVRGNIYALHDEPLQLVETLGLDDVYLDWLENSASGRHTRHPRAIAIASAVLNDMRAKLQDGKDISALEHPLPRRADAVSTAARVVAGQPPEGGFFSMGASSISGILNRDYQKPRVKATHNNQVQKLYPDENPQLGLSTETVPSDANHGGEYRNCTDGGVSTETVLRSSSNNKYIYKNTTTTPVVNTEVGGSTETVLAWPDGLSRADKGVLRQQLAITPAQHHQPVLDALAVKLAEVAAGRSQPLRNGILPYTRKLCELAAAGKLNPVPRPASGKPADNPPPDNPNNPLQPDPQRELKELGTRVSDLANEVRHLKMLGQAGGFTPANLAEVTEEWRSASQRYEQLRQSVAEMQGRVLH